MRRVLSPHQRLWVISTLLVALLVRALIPAGFMPATDRPFSFQICPDGFPAALLQNPSTGGGADAPAGRDAAWHVAHHHDVSGAAHAGHQHDATALAHAGHHHGVGSTLNPHADGALAAAHHHEGPLHNHGAASAEHCVFAAAAGVFALAFAATLSAPAANISSPDVEYPPTSYESLRFRRPQPRGPPALS